MNDYTRRINTYSPGTCYIDLFLSISLLLASKTVFILTCNSINSVVEHCEKSIELGSTLLLVLSTRSNMPSTSFSMSLI